MIATANSARFRLTAFWLAVCARSVGQTAATVFAILQMGRGEMAYSIGILFLWLGITAVPAFALAPLIGALASSRNRWPIMVAATVVGLAIIAWSSIADYRTGHTFWLGLVGVLAFESAFFSACRFAVLPEAARLARVSLPQLIGVFAFAIVAGMAAGIWIGIDQLAAGLPGLPAPLAFGLGGYGFALVCILLAHFPVEKPVRLSDGLIKPYWRTVKSILRTSYGRNSLLALWGLFAIGLTVNRWLMPDDLRITFFLALAIGIVLGSLHAHPHRTLGIVPYAAIGLAASAIWANGWNNWNEPALALAFFIGIMIPPLLTIYTIYQPDETRGHGAAALHAGWSAIAGAFLIVLLRNANDVPLARSVFGDAVLVLSLIGVVFAWYVFFRATVEVTIEGLIWPMYRIKAIGPGVPLMPLKGPVLMIANHAAWFDPFWLAKVVPAPVVPMMISRFYDLRVVSWFMRNVIHAIRVPDVPLRKEAPEIKEAIAALNHGDCVFIFPEGWLRRKEEQEMRRFARGVWHILKARPSTPVFPCWIEGGWGSMVSHKGGPPLKNKKLDKWRKIRIAIGEPLVLDPEVLKTHMATRTLLMKAVLDARLLLGLPPIDPFKLQAHDDDVEKPAEPVHERPA